MTSKTKKVKKLRQKKSAVRLLKTGGETVIGKNKTKTPERAAYEPRYQL
jgi:hypothetical protein